MHFGCGRIGGATDRVQYLQAQLFPVCTITAKGNQKYFIFYIYRV